MSDAEFRAKLLEIGQCYDLKSLEKGAKIIGRIQIKKEEPYGID